MNKHLWIIQFGIAIFYLVVGFMQIVLPKNDIEKRMRWVVGFKPITIKLIGLVEVVTAVGLVLPEIIDVDPFLTPLSAYCMAIVMLGAIRINFKRKESGMVMLNILLLILLAAVVYGRLFSRAAIGD